MPIVVLSEANSRAHWLGVLLLFLMLVFPMTLPVAYVNALLLMAILIAVNVAALKTGIFPLDWSVFLWAYGLSMLGCVFVAEGLFVGAPGTMRCFQTYVLCPMVFVIVIAGIRSENTLYALARTCGAAAICIVGIAVVFLLTQIGVLPSNNVVELLSFNFGENELRLGEGFLAIQLPGINSLPFLVPFLIAATATFVVRSGSAPPIRRGWLWLTTLSGLLAGVISGRRAFQLVTLAAPLGVLLLSFFLPTQERPAIRRALGRMAMVGVACILVVTLALGSIIGISLGGLTDRLAAGFDFGATGEEGAIARNLQFHALIAGWSENPIFGAGFGRPAYGWISSPKTPWNYELHYLALLYQTGLVGLLSYFAGVLWIYWMGIRVIRSGGNVASLMISCLVGMTCLLIANATNPYLARYDGLYPIFLPLGVINWWLCRERLAAVQSINSFRDSSAGFHSIP